MLKNKEKIRLIHVVPSLDTGGMENGVINLCNRHDRAIFEPGVCYLSYPGAMANRLRSDVEVLCPNITNKSLLRCISKLSTLFRQKKPHIVHTHAYGGGSFIGIIAAKLAGINVIINGEHGSFFLIKRHQIMVQKFLALLCSEYLSVSEGLKEKIVQNLGLSPGKITVIPNGVDTTLFSGDYDTTAMRRELSERHGVVLENKNFAIGCIGSLKPEKNQKLLLDALSRIKPEDKRKMIKVLFVGDGADLSYLKYIAARNGLEKQVTFLGVRNDIPQLLSLMDILVSTSISSHEGLSNVILEAMSSSLPVISTSSTGAHELIIDAGSGFLIDQWDIEGLRLKIELLFQDRVLCRKMGGNARRIVREKYSIEKMVKSYESLYFNTLKL